jgi:hypothetical protein
MESIRASLQLNRNLMTRNNYELEMNENPAMASKENEMKAAVAIQI